MNMLNVTPLIPGREKDITDDLKDMYRRGIVRSAAFEFTLVPEGKPTIDKAARLCELYRKNVELMKGCDIPLGVLIQATMGHGWTPDEKADFQRFTFRDGREPYTFCPLDKNFLNHIYGQIVTIAREKPDFFMLDDDTRMITGRGGCFCPLHIAKFNEITGQNFTRESLLESLAKDPDGLGALWDNLQRDSVVGLAKTIRSAVDSVNTQTPIYFCQCASDTHHAPAMLKALSAPGQKPVLRINNGSYLNDSLIWMPYWMTRTMWQVCALPKDYILLDEPDTCPQTRYSTAAAILNLHYAWATLVGCRGAKLWITPMSNYDPETGREYRKTLQEHAGFYTAISQMNPQWQGFAEVMPNAPEKTAVKFHPDSWSLIPRPTWSADVFSFMGLPFSHEPHSAELSKKRMVLLSGAKTTCFSSEELLEMLKGNVLLDGEAAINLTERGFASMLGLKAQKWSLPAASYEIGVDGTNMQSGLFMAQLTDLQPGAEIRSTLYHRGFAWAETGTPVGPGLVRYRNSEGGCVVTCAAILKPHPGSGFEPFGMLRRIRKLWLARELNVGMYYDGTAPMYFCRFMDGKHDTAVAINLGLDADDAIPLANVPEGVKSVQMLQNNGVWMDVPFENNAIKVTLLPAQIAFFRFS